MSWVAGLAEVDWPHIRYCMCHHSCRFKPTSEAFVVALEVALPVEYKLANIEATEKAPHAQP
eukprot:1656808-Amphidinium_carterae.1